MVKKNILIFIFLFFVQLVSAKQLEIVPLSVPFSGEDFKRCFVSVRLSYEKNMSNSKYEDAMVACENQYTHSDDIEEIPAKVLKEICTENDCGRNLNFEGLIAKFSNLKSKNMSLYLWNSYRIANNQKIFLTTYSHNNQVVHTIPVLFYRYKRDKNGRVINIIPKNDFDLYYTGTHLMINTYRYQNRKRVLREKYIILK